MTGNITCFKKNSLIYPLRSSEQKLYLYSIFSSLFIKQIGYSNRMIILGLLQVQ